VHDEEVIRVEFGTIERVRSAWATIQPLRTVSGRENAPAVY